MRPFIFLASALALLPATSLLATTYYVSPNGNDNYPGFLTATPWKTVAKVNKSRFQPGDSILFLAGGTWREELIPPASNLTFGAYGTGARPIISGANLYNTGWTEATGSSTVWKVSVGSYQPGQVWFNTVLGQPVATQSAIIAPNQWCYLSGYLYVYSKTNPATAFTGPGVEAAQRDSALYIAGVTNTTVSGMAFVNPNYTAIDIETTAAGTQTFTNVVWKGAQYEGLRAEAGTQKVTNSEGLYNELGIGIGGGDGITLTNSILSGNSDGAIEVMEPRAPAPSTNPHSLEMQQETLW